MALFLIISITISSFSRTFGLNQTYTCSNVGNQPVFYDSSCSAGQSLGCNAGGLGQNCRFCGFSYFVSCPGYIISNTTNSQGYTCSNVGNQPVFYDSNCSAGQSLGCNAGGLGQNCRFCGFDIFVPCPSKTTSTAKSTKLLRSSTTTSTSTSKKLITITSTSSTAKTKITTVKIRYTTTTLTTVKTTTATTISTRTATSKTLKTTTATTPSAKTTTTTISINWNGNNWAMACDFLGQDLSNILTTGPQW